MNQDQGDQLPEELAQDLKGNYRKFMERYYEEVRKFVSPQVGNDQGEALKITAEVFERVHRTFKDRDSSYIRARVNPSYLCDIAKHVIQDYRRNKDFMKRQKKTVVQAVSLDHLDDHQEIPEKPTTMPVRIFLSKDIRLIVVNAIDSLHEGYVLEKEILRAYLVQGHTYDEIEGIFDISYDVARKRILRGIKLLRKILMVEPTNKIYKQKKG